MNGLLGEDLFQISPPFCLPHFLCKFKTVSGIFYSKSAPPPPPRQFQRLNKISVRYLFQGKYDAND